MTIPTADIAGCRAAHERFLATIDGLTDDQVRAPSLLPGWTIAHLLTHLARNADSVTRRLKAAARGDVVDQYPGGRSGRAAEIEAGAGRPASELIADVRDSAIALDARFASVTPEVWERPVRAVGRPDRPAREMVFARWREVEVHHVDLGFGYTPADWPAGLVAGWLPSILETLAERTDAPALLAWTLGRGPAPDLAPWA